MTERQYCYYVHYSQVDYRLSTDLSKMSAGFFSFSFLLVEIDELILKSIRNAKDLE